MPDSSYPTCSTIIRIVIPGIHRWPDVDAHMGGRVSYLKHPHRHNFHITAKYRVDPDGQGGRAVEYFTQAENLRATLNLLYPAFNTLEIEVTDFGSSSCEQIAMRVLDSDTTGTLYSVEVSEDGLHGGEALR